MIDYAEKRDFLRMPIDCQLSFTAAGSSLQQAGKVINLSSKGILFTTDERLAQGDRLEILLTPYSPETPPLEASVVVSRVTDNDAVFEVACEIEESR